MAGIYPFEGIHYDDARVPLAQVIAPPYDVLSPDQQRELYDRHPCNIIRIILNRQTPEDSEAENRYTRAAGYLREWLANGVLVRDSVPAYYEYLQRFAHPNDPLHVVERQTLFVALKLEPYDKGVVLPHEETHPSAKADRLDLMRATRANPEPIYALYEDPARAVAQALAASRAENGPLLRAAVPGAPGAAADEHLLYRHSAAPVFRDLGEFMARRRVWIADGHHRYETGLNYQRERRREEGDPSETRDYDSLLVGLSSFEDPGLLVLPTHRLIRNIPAARLQDLLPLLQRYFQVRALTHEAAREWIGVEQAGEKRFALIRPDGAFGLILRDISQAEAGAADGHCEAWKRLDVTVLQTLVLDRTLGISWTTLAHTADVAYTRDAQEAVAKVRDGEYQIACLLQNPTVTEVRDVASAGDKMPQKSTFFYPKLWSGLILRGID